MISILPEEKKLENDEKKRQADQKRIENSKSFSQVKYQLSIETEG